MGMRALCAPKEVLCKPGAGSKGQKQEWPGLSTARRPVRWSTGARDRRRHLN